MATLLEIQQQKVSNQVKVELYFNAFLAVCPQVQPIETALNATKEKLNLPSVRIKHNNLMGLQVQTVGGNSVGFSQWPGC